MADRRGDGSGAGWSRRFFLVTGLQFLCYGNVLMLNSVLALYLTALGYSVAFVGLVVGAFSVASVLCRPYIGLSVDRWSAVGTYLVGAAAIAAGTFGYLLSNPATLMVSRMVNGIGWAAINTAGPSIALSGAPSHRKGAAIGYFQAFRAVTIPVAPAAGLWAADVLSFEAVFLIAGSLAVIAILLTPMLYGDRGAPAAPDSPDGRLIEARVLLPAAIQALIYCSAPLIFVFMPLYAQERAISGLPYFFLAVGLTTIAVQPMGRLSDTWGRGPNMAVGLILSAAGLLILPFSGDLGSLMTGGVLWAAGQSLVEPATAALAVDSVSRFRRGAALATYGAAFQVAQGGGGLLWGVTISGVGFSWAFFGAAALAVAGIVLLGAQWKRIQLAGGPAHAT